MWGGGSIGVKAEGWDLLLYTGGVRFWGDTLGSLDAGDEGGGGEVESPLPGEKGGNWGPLRAESWEVPIIWGGGGRNEGPLPRGGLNSGVPFPLCSTPRGSDQPLLLGGGGLDRGPHPTQPPPEPPDSPQALQLHPEPAWRQRGGRLLRHVMRWKGEVRPPAPTSCPPLRAGTPPPLFVLPDAVPPPPLSSPHRFEGQERWLCADSRGRWSPEVLQFRHVPVVALDLSGSQLTYDGLDNLGETPPPPGDAPEPHGAP